VEEEEEEEEDDMEPREGVFIWGKWRSLGRSLGSLQRVNLQVVTPRLDFFQQALFLGLNIVEAYSDSFAFKY